MHMIYRKQSTEVIWGHVHIRIVTEERDSILYFFLEELEVLSFGPEEGAGFVSFHHVGVEELFDLGHNGVGAFLGIIIVGVGYGDGSYSLRSS